MTRGETMPCDGARVAFRRSFEGGARILLLTLPGVCVGVLFQRQTTEGEARSESSEKANQVPTTGAANFQKHMVYRAHTTPLNTFRNNEHNNKR